MNADCSAAAKALSFLVKSSQALGDTIITALICQALWFVLLANTLHLVRKTCVFCLFKAGSLFL